MTAKLSSTTPDGASAPHIAPSIAPQTASRFAARWINAAADRADMVHDLAKTSLRDCDFAQIVQTYIDDGLPLARAMRRLRNLIIVTLIERDLSGQSDLDEVVTCMTAFADFAIATHVAAIHADMIALHGTPIGEETQEPQELIVLGMGKLGGGELNVSSDIDLIFTYSEDGDTVPDASGQKSLSNHEFFVRFGKKLIAALSEITEDGFCFRVDMALRPNGGSGPLAASFNMVEQYLIVQGREWERYAWVKARAVTGRAADIAALDKIVYPFVYRRYLDFGMIDAIRNMHQQIRTEVNRQERLHPDRSNNVKLGRGGIREIEFLVQVFQLIRGGREATLRERSTRDTLRVLADKQLLDSTVVEQLLHAYNFLRNLEHRLQYLDDAQTHTLPANPADQLCVAQMMGYADTAALMAELEVQRGFVASQFDAIFSDKTQTQSQPHNTTKNTSGEATIDPQSHGALTDSDNREAIAARLAELGFDAPSASAQRLLATWQSPRLQSLPEKSRSKLVSLINTALPLITALAAEARFPMQTTLGLLLDFFETIARRSAYLSLLTEYPHALARVIRMLSASGWAAKFLTRHPIVLDELLDERLRHVNPDWHALHGEINGQLAFAAGDTERQMDLLREIHHSQMFRILARDLAGDLSVERVADDLSALADAIVAATVQAVWQTLPNRHRDIPKFAVIAYGRLGGKELGYSSDLDVIFLFDDDDPEAQGLYAKLVQRFITWMTTHTAAGILFDIDTALRPDGASGMLVSSIAAFERYQNNAAWVWEHQALSRARFCAGDAAIGERFEHIRETVLRKPRQAADLKREVLAMRKKMHEAYAKRSPLFDLKQDSGGMIDIEFIVQTLVLLHAATHPQLTANLGNISLLKICGQLGLIDAALAAKVADAYRKLRKLQHQIRLKGEAKARIETDKIADEIAAVTQLWQAVFDVHDRAELPIY
jgi:glutamate-ammonia-ligase adenylyltransferase